MIFSAFWLEAGDNCAFVKRDHTVMDFSLSTIDGRLGFLKLLFDALLYFETLDWGKFNVDYISERIKPKSSQKSNPSIPLLFFFFFFFFFFFTIIYIFFPLIFLQIPCRLVIPKAIT
jgi:hypothetical protein